jgi:hypothetical protein
MAEEVNRLFYPWFFGGELKGEIENYLNGPEDHLDSFKAELLRLYDEFNQIPEENTLYILNIGANCSEEDLPCWHREIPSFILGSVASPLKIKVLLVDNFKEGYVPKTTRLELFSDSIQTETGWSIPDFLDIKLFRTYFPSNYPTKKAFSPRSHQYQIIEERKRLSLDEEFINSFYSKLDQFVAGVCRVGSIFIALSTASFKNDFVTESIAYEGKQDQDGYGNRTLELYPELLNIINPSTSSCFYLFVWPFESEYMQLFGTKVFVKYNDMSGENIKIEKKGGRLVLTPLKKELGAFRNTSSKLFQVLFRK